MFKKCFLLKPGTGLALNILKTFILPIYFDFSQIHTHYKLGDGRQIDEVITWARRVTQMGELVEIVANTLKFNFI